MSEQEREQNKRINQHQRLINNLRERLKTQGYFILMIIHQEMNLTSELDALKDTPSDKVSSSKARASLACLGARSLGRGTRPGSHRKL